MAVSRHTVEGRWGAIRSLGGVGRSMAVANVLRRVPGLPWWRVVPSSGRLYRTHRPTQEPLLRAAGVEVDETGRVVMHRPS